MTGPNFPALPSASPVARTALERTVKHRGRLVVQCVMGGGGIVRCLGRTCFAVTPECKSQQRRTSSKRRCQERHQLAQQGGLQHRHQNYQVWRIRTVQAAATPNANGSASALSRRLRRLKLNVTAVDETIPPRRPVRPRPRVSPTSRRAMYPAKLSPLNNSTTNHSWRGLNAS